MIFSVNPTSDKLIEQAYKEGMEELNKFFEINWIRDTPTIFTIPDRKTIDLIRKKPSEDWVIGWADDKLRAIYILEAKDYEKESCHKYSDEKYTALIKHELVHLFMVVFSKNNNLKPIWLHEGIAIYLSGQNELRKIPKDAKFSRFLNSHDKYEEGLYQESGFAVKILIERNGKEKFLQLVKETKKTEPKEEFTKRFKKIYGFELNYDYFNRFLPEIKINMQ